MSVGDICNRYAAIIGKSDSVHDAAKLMRDRRVNDVVVVESSGGYNLPVGMISARDIVVDLVTSRKDLGSISMGDVMSTHFPVAKAQDGVTPTLKRMRNKNVRCIPVISANRALIGILSIDDILDVLAEQLNDIAYIISRQYSVTRTAGLDLRNTVY